MGHDSFCDRIRAFLHAYGHGSATATDPLAAPWGVAGETEQTGRAHAELRYAPRVTVAEGLGSMPRLSLK